eukprot:2528996-Rhodomonas_salina.2
MSVGSAAGACDAGRKCAPKRPTARKERDSIAVCAAELRTSHHTHSNHTLSSPPRTKTSALAHSLHRLPNQTFCLLLLAPSTAELPPSSQAHRVIGRLVERA